MAISSSIENVTDLWNAYKRGEVMSDEVRDFLQRKYNYPPAELTRIINTWNSIIRNATNDAGPTEGEQGAVLEGLTLPMQASDQTGKLMYSPDYGATGANNQQGASNQQGGGGDTRTSWVGDISKRAQSWQDRYRDYIASVIGLDKPGVSLGTRLEAEPTLGYGATPAMGQYLLGSGAGQYKADPMLEGIESRTQADVFGDYITSRGGVQGVDDVRSQYGQLANYLGTLGRQPGYGATTDTEGTAQWARMFGAPGTAEENQRLASNVMAATQAALGANPFATGALSNIYQQMERNRGTAKALSDFANWAGTSWA